VSSDRVTVYVDVETDESLAELADFSRKVDDVGSKWQRVKMVIRSESRQVMQSLLGLVNLAKDIIEAFGYSIGPVGEALLAIITSVIQGAIAMQFAYAAGGPVGWAMMAISAAALGVAIGASIRAAQGVAEAKESAAKTQAILGSLTSILGPWRTF